MCRLFLMTVALLAILFGISGLYMMPKLIQKKIEERIQLKIGTSNFERFTRVPIPIKVKFYLFNVTNSEQVLRGLERPKFQEVGPFMYEQWRRRSIVDIIDNNRKITYREYKTFYSMWPANHEEVKIKYLDDDNDNDNDNEQHQSSDNKTSQQEGQATRRFMLNPRLHNVTVINLPLLSILTKLADFEEGSLKRNVAAKLVSRLIQSGREQILINRRVNELLFDGYKVGVLEAAKSLISETLGFNFDSPLPNNKFGFFHGKNQTWKRDEAGELTIFTGRNESMNDFMMVDNWNGLHTLNTWPKNTEAKNRCNEIRGTDGSQFHPGVTRDQVLGIFSPMICTSIQVKYKEDTSCRDIPLLRFGTTAQMFAAPKKSAQNACYCTIKDPSPTAESLEFINRLLASSTSSINLNSTSVAAKTATTSSKSRITNSRCYIDGLMDLSLCQKGAPVAASSPHFYNGDPLLAMAAGLQPSKSRHETYMDIEPMTGAVMRAASRAQLNAFVEQAALDVVDAQLIGNMTPMVAPMLWLEEAAEIDEKSSRLFKAQLLNTVNKSRLTFIYAIVFGVLLALIVSIQYWYVTCYSIDASVLAKRKEIRRKKRQLQLEREASELKLSSAKTSASSGGRPRSRSRSSSASNRRRARPNHLVSGARKSNLAQIRLVSRDDRALVPANLSEQADKSKASAVAVVAAAAVAMGAADSAVGRNQRHSRPSKRNARQHDDHLANDDDELSRRALVEHEWCPAGNQTATTASSSTGGQEEPDYQEPDYQEPSTSDAGLVDLVSASNHNDDDDY